MTLDPDTLSVPRPEVSVAQIALLILAKQGRTPFARLIKHPLVRELGAVRSENSFYTALARLKRRRCITRAADGHYELTPHGEYAALKAYIRKEFTQQEKTVATSSTSGRPASFRSWDGRWRIVFFDVPESKRPIRDYIRGVLKRQGFKEFQRSMWIYPHKLPTFMSKLLADPQIRRYARVVTTYDIDYDDDLRRSFRLS